MATAMVMVMEANSTTQRTMIKNLFKLFSSSSNLKNPLEVDLHSHLIPGIDDGAKTMEQSIELIRSLKSMGYNKLITTPHIMSHRFPNTKEIILKGLDNLKEECQKEKIDIEIEAAAEYYLDSHFLELLDAKDVLTFGDNYCLFELSYSIAPRDLLSIVFKIQSLGYKPVLAHPERYGYFHHDFSLYEELKEYNLLFQLNSNSLSGYYSKNVQKIAQKLVKNSMVDFVGSDTHKTKHIEVHQKVLQSSSYHQLFKNNTILNSTLL